MVGKLPVRFSCIGGRCVYDPHGQFSDLFSCIKQCKTAPPPPSIAQTLCGKDKVIEYGTRRIQTNLWGVPSNESINYNKNCVFLNSDGTFGWKWDRPNPQALPGDQYVAPIYPDITTGTSPWGGYASNPNLPIKVSDILSLTLSVDYRYSVLPSQSDSLNFAYDMWVLDKPVPDQVSLDTKKEIMIWISKQNVPMPAPIAKVSDGINTYNLDAWEGYNAFMLEAPLSSGNKSHRVNANRLLDYLVAHDLIPADWYLAEIALGNEIWKSQGQINIKTMTYELNGVNI